MTIPSINHVILTVSDMDKVRAFYGDLLGFEIKEVPLDDGLMLYFPVEGDGAIWFIKHQQMPPGDRFSEFRIGLDHLAFTAPSKEFLHELADKLIAAGVDTKGVEVFYGQWLYVAFRDPDNIQLEYWLNEKIDEAPADA
jgi:glyoxylase I family protein